MIDVPSRLLAVTVGLTVLPEAANAWAGPVTAIRLNAPVASATIDIRMQCLFTVEFPHRVVYVVRRVLA